MQQWGTLNAGLLLGATCLTALPVTAQDGGVSIVLGVEQRLSYGRNVGLEVPAEGSTSRSTTRLRFGITSQTPLDTLSFTAATSLVAENSPSTDGTEYDIDNPDLRLTYTREIPNALLSFEAQLRRDDVDEFGEDIAEDDEPGTRTDHGLRLTYETGRQSPLGFMVGAEYLATEYEDTVDPDLDDTQTRTLMAGLRFDLSEVTTARLDFELEREEEDDPLELDTDTWTAMAGVELDRPNGSLGGLLTYTDVERSEQRTTLEVIRALTFPDGELEARLGVTHASETGTDLVGALTWSRTLPDTRLDVSLVREVSYDVDDDETVEDTSLGVAWSRDVNPLSSLTLGFTYEISDSPSELIEQAEVEAIYSYSLTPDWQLESGVSYTVRDDLDGRATSPAVFVSLGREFNLRP